MKKLDLALCGFRVYQAKPEDLHTIHIIDAQSMLSSVHEEWFLERWKKFQDRFFVAKLNYTGKIIGYITAAGIEYYPDHLKNFIYLSRFAVSRGYRRCGVGMELCKAMEKTVSQSKEGCNGLVGDIRRSNDISRAFFRSAGFSEHKELSVPNWYETGLTDDDHNKVVVYKHF
jgi:ribosomal protein S18 acetylase RimI-like enzyme